MAKSGDRAADRIVPSTGFTSVLTVVSAGVIEFLAVLTLALSFAASELAERWQAELAGTATVRIAAPSDEREAQTQAVMRALEQTPGIATARVVSDQEQQELLAPWFGSDLPLDTLRLPILIEIVEDEFGPDPEGLRQRLAAEAPGAEYDNHGRWRAPLVRAAEQLSQISRWTIFLIAGVTAITIALAASASLAANGQIIEVLRSVGASDAWIRRAFVRRFTVRALIGGGVGMVAGVLVMMAFPSGIETGILSGLGFSGLEWIWPIFVPPVTALLAYIATYVAALRRLREVS